MELTNTNQWKDESIVDYINGWHSLSLDSKDRLFEVASGKICIQECIGVFCISSKGCNLALLIRVFPAGALDFGPLMGVINKIYNLYHHALG